MKKLATTAAVLALGAATVAVAPAASAKQDTACMQSGIAFLKKNDLFSTVAANGLAVSTAVSVGVAPRAGTDVSALPAVLPLSVVLADHRAGSDSLFIYPWC